MSLILWYCPTLWDPLSWVERYFSLSAIGSRTELESGSSALKSPGKYVEPIISFLSRLYFVVIGCELFPRQEYTNLTMFWIFHKVWCQYFTRCYTWRPGPFPNFTILG